jgi:hypothetical protein
MVTWRRSKNRTKNQSKNRSSPGSTTALLKVSWQRWIQDIN